jgi:type I restriction enzyme, S subunit
MGTDVNYVELSALLSVKPRNGLYKGKEFQGSGHRWIKMGEIFGNDFFTDQTTELLTVTESEIDRFSCEAGDLVFGRTSLTLEGVGDCMLIGEIHDVPIFESNLFRLRFDKKVASPLFYFYYFKSVYGKQLIQKIAKQTAAASITAADLIAQPVPYFDKGDQDRVAAVIHGFDKKIELNRQMNATLESMAQALFKSWFVDFDPVIDNALEAGNPIPEALQARAATRQTLGEQRKPLPETIRKQFPSCFEFSEEMGWIPEGWEVGSILEQADLLSGGTPKTSVDNYWDGDILWASAKDVSQCKDAMLIQTGRKISQEGLDNSSTKLIDKFATVVVSRGATTGRLTMFGDIIAMNQTCYALRSRRGTHFFQYCHALSAISKLVNSAHGSVFDTITTNTFRSTNVLLPHFETVDAFENQVQPYFEKLLSNLKATAALSNLRDTLLPKLLSGQLRITDVEKQLAEAI